MEQPYDPGSLRRSELIGGIVYWPAFLLVIPQAAILAMQLFWPTTDYALALTRINFLFGLFNAAALVLLFRRYLKEQFSRLQLRGRLLFADVGLGYAVYFGLAWVAGNVISLLAGLFSVETFNANQEAVEAAVRTVPALAIIDACLLAPPAEELLTRGLIFCGLYRRSRFWAYALSMLAFSLAHCAASIPYQPVGVTVINFLTYLPAGFILARVYERSETIWTSIFLHGFINAMSLVLQAVMR